MGRKAPAAGRSCQLFKKKNGRGFPANFSRYHIFHQEIVKLQDQLAIADK